MFEKEKQKIMRTKNIAYVDEGNYFTQHGIYSISKFSEEEKKEYNEDIRDLLVWGEHIIKIENDNCENIKKIRESARNGKREVFCFRNESNVYPISHSEALSILKDIEKLEKEKEEKKRIAIEKREKELQELREKALEKAKKTRKPTFVRVLGSYDTDPNDGETGLHVVSELITPDGKLITSEYDGY